jgi:tetratricopeptide (TPR) repeat protein
MGRSCASPMLVWLALASTAGVGAAADPPRSADGALAPRLTNLGTLHRAITTANPDAQAFFDQGLRLVFGFNHAEAVRAFREAQRLDPRCAMCLWGEAYALGPNVNDPITPDREKEADAALQRARGLATGATAAEQGLIEALAPRYSSAPAGDRSGRDAAFTAAMKALAARFPHDPEINVMYAAAAMEARPWRYWKEQDVPEPEIAEALATLERMITEYPDHPGAHHFYIHIVEATSRPDRGVPSAERLESLMPGAGHLVHMPAHIYMRVGRYAEAAESNVRAIAADEDYLAQCQAQGMYPVGYYPHNIHFLWSAATMEGRSEVALDAARKVAAKLNHDMLHDAVALQDFQSVPYYAFVRFGQWQEMLTEGQPPKDFAFTTAMWHYGRGIAFAARGQLDRARTELEALQAQRSSPPLQGAELAGTPLTAIVDLAARILDGELASRERRYDEAIASLTAAVALQDAQRYNEPPTWHYPVRQSLGAVLLEAGQAAKAEAVYREDLRRNPENGWSLFGLAKSLEAQQKIGEAEEVRARFRRAWNRADVRLTASRF